MLETSRQDPSEQVRAAANAALISWPISAEALAPLLRSGLPPSAAAAAAATDAATPGQGTRSRKRAKGAQGTPQTPPSLPVAASGDCIYDLLSGEETSGLMSLPGRQIHRHVIRPSLRLVPPWRTCPAHACLRMQHASGTASGFARPTVLGTCRRADRAPALGCAGAAAVEGCAAGGGPAGTPACLAAGRQGPASGIWATTCARGRRWRRQVLEPVCSAPVSAWLQLHVACSSLPVRCWRGA